MPSLYTSLIANVVFPLQELLKGHSTVAVLRGMDESQWWSPERLREHQLHRLRTFLGDIGIHVPYYRELFKAQGFIPEAVQSMADLARLPFLTKRVIRANTDQLKANDARDLARFNTGGSSGEPLIFYIGKERISHDVAAKWRATRWWNVDIGDKELVVWGSPIEIAAQDRVRLLRDRLMRTELLPAFEMSTMKLDEFVACIRKRRPKMLFGYPSSLSMIARHAERHRVDMTNLGIKVAFVTSERLYPDQRETIGRVFGCKVANGYGGRDAGFVAHECQHGAMHVTAEDVLIEIVDSSGQSVPVGVPGEIVVTHLATRDFPFVRYRTGDIGVMDDRPCECGRGLPVVREIQGRTTDFVVASDGTVMHALALIYVIRDLPGIESFKVIQEDVLHTRVLVIPSSDYDMAIGNRIVEGLQRRLGASVEISVELVDTLSTETSGKFRYVTSHVTL